jgi:hypothetical protein
VQYWSKRSLYALSTALTLSLASVAVQAQQLPVTNLDFNSLTHPITPGFTKDYFTAVQPTDWNVGTNGGANGNLTFVGEQGSEVVSGAGANSYAVYNNPGFNVTVPPNTNFFQADGNPLYEDTIYQQITGLTANTTYSLQFQQAAGQQDAPPFFLPTMEQWKVFLGAGNIGTACTPAISPTACHVTGLTNNIEHDSPLMNDGGQMNVDWNNVTMSFTPTASELTGGTATLTFLAWGDGGSPANEPPTVFLEGVNTTPIPAPEPATLTIVGVGLVGLGAIRRLRRGKRSASV